MFTSGTDISCVCAEMILCRACVPLCGGCGRLAGLDAGVQTSVSYAAEQAVADWMREGRDGRPPSTLRRDERILRPVLAVIGSIPLHALRAHDVRRALSE